MTPSTTKTATATSTNTATASQTASTTNTASASRTASTTNTATATRTASSTNTATASRTASTTNTATSSRTPSTTHTATATRTSSSTNTATASRTASTTNTASSSRTPSTTNTATASRTSSSTNTATASRTASTTNTATSSRTPSTTNTATASRTASTTNTATASRTASTTNTASATKTPSTTNTATASQTPSTTNTATASQTPSTTNTATASRTASTTNTATATRTASTTNTATATPSVTPSTSPSVTPTPSQVCPKSCKTCYTYLNESSCETCPGGRFLNDTVNVDYAPPPGKMCCDMSCTTCATTELSGCLTCNATLGRFINEGAAPNFCCDPTCRTCNGPNVNNCASCGLDQPLFNGICCHASCSTCSGPLATQCASCPAGFALRDRFTPGPCIACDPTCATCSIPESASSCTACPANRNKNTPGVGDSFCCHSTCKTCNGPDDTKCVSCTAPRFLNPSGASACCDPTCGSCNGPSLTNCTSCPSGSDFTFQLGNTPPGICKPLCPVFFETWQPDYSCGLCANGEHTIAQRAVLGCVPCPNGTYYWNTGVTADPCAKCNQDTAGKIVAECAGGASRPVAMPGYFLVSDNPAKFEVCIPAQVCAGGNQCREGQTGYKCQDCAGDYYKSDGQATCEACPKSALLFVCIFIVVGVIFCVILTKLARKATSYFASLNVGLSFIQILSLFHNYNVKWPPALTVVWGGFEYFDLNLHFLQPQCTLALLDPYVVLWLIKLAIPAFFGIAFITAYTFVRAYHAVRSTRKATELPCCRRWPSFTIPEILMLKNVFINSFLTACIFTYMMIGRTALEIFKCTYHPEDGTLTMDREPSILCTSAKWKAMVFASCVVLAFFIVGLPVFVISRLVRNRNVLWKDSSVVRYGLMYQRYRLKYYWWEAAFFARRIGLILSSTVGVYSSLGQPIVALGVVVAAAVVQIVVQPYRSKTVNRLETAYLVCSAVILLFGCLFYGLRDDISSQSRNFQQALAIVVIILVFMLCLVILLSIAAEVRRQFRLRKRGVIGKYASDQISVTMTFFDSNLHVTNRRYVTSEGTMIHIVLRFKRPQGIIVSLTQGELIGDYRQPFVDFIRRCCHVNLRRDILGEKPTVRELTPQQFARVVRVQTSEGGSLHHVHVLLPLAGYYTLSVSLTEVLKDVKPLTRFERGLALFEGLSREPTTQIIDFMVATERPASDRQLFVRRTKMFRCRGGIAAFPPQLFLLPATQYNLDLRLNGAIAVRVCVTRPDLASNDPEVQGTRIDGQPDLGLFQGPFVTPRQPGPLYVWARFRVKRDPFDSMVMGEDYEGAVAAIQGIAAVAAQGTAAAARAAAIKTAAGESTDWELMLEYQVWPLGDNPYLPGGDTQLCLTMGCWDEDSRGMNAEGKWNNKWELSEYRTTLALALVEPSLAAVGCELVMPALARLSTAREYTFSIRAPGAVAAVLSLRRPHTPADGLPLLQKSYRDPFLFTETTYLEGFTEGELFLWVGFPSPASTEDASRSWTGAVIQPDWPVFYPWYKEQLSSSWVDSQVVVAPSHISINVRSRVIGRRADALCYRVTEIVAHTHSVSEPCVWLVTRRKGVVQKHRLYFRNLEASAALEAALRAAVPHTLTGMALTGPLPLPATDDFSDVATASGRQIRFCPFVRYEVSIGETPPTFTADEEELFDWDYEWVLDDAVVPMPFLTGGNPDDYDVHDNSPVQYDEYRSFNLSGNDVSAFASLIPIRATPSPQAELEPQGGIVNPLYAVDQSPSPTLSSRQSQRQSVLLDPTLSPTALLASPLAREHAGGRLSLSAVALRSLGFVSPGALGIAPDGSPPSPRSKPSTPTGDRPASPGRGLGLITPPSPTAAAAPQEGALVTHLSPGEPLPLGSSGRPASQDNVLALSNLPRSLPPPLLPPEATIQFLPPPPSPSALDATKRISGPQPSPTAISDSKRSSGAQPSPTGAKRRSSKTHDWIGSGRTARDRWGVVSGVFMSSPVESLADKAKRFEAGKDPAGVGVGVGAMAPLPEDAAADQPAPVDPPASPHKPAFIKAVRAFARGTEKRLSAADPRRSMAMFPAFDITALEAARGRSSLALGGALAEDTAALPPLTILDEDIVELDDLRAHRADWETGSPDASGEAAPVVAPIQPDLIDDGAIGCNPTAEETAEAAVERDPWRFFRCRRRR